MAECLPNYLECPCFQSMGKSSDKSDKCACTSLQTCATSCKLWGSCNTVVVSGKKTGFHIGRN